MEVKYCKTCGKQLPENRHARLVYCSIECNPRKRKPTAIQGRTCPVCGKTVVRKYANGGCPKYCSTRCRWLATYERNPAKYYKPCVLCEKPVLQYGGRIKYCSPECRSLDAIKNQTQTCQLCGKSFKYKQLRKYCSKKCQIKALHKSNQENGMWEKKIKQTCGYCGKTYYVAQCQNLFKFCSNKCCNAFWGKKYRANKKNVVSKDYSFAEVCEKDKYICQLCGKPVDTSLNYPDPMSASIDHIYPISKGGPDIIENVQLTHLSCNIRKNNKIIKETSNKRVIEGVKIWQERVQHQSQLISDRTE